MRGSLRHFLQYQNQHSIAQHAQPSARFPNVDDGKIDRKPTRLRVKPMVFYLRFDPKFIHWNCLEIRSFYPTQRIHSTMFFFTSWNWFKPNQLIRILRSIEKVFSEELPVDHEEIEFHQLCIIYIYIWYIITKNHIWLVGGIPTPLKNHGVKVSWDDDIPNIWSSHLLADVSRRLSETLDLRKKRPRKRQV